MLLEFVVGLTFFLFILYKCCTGSDSDPSSTSHRGTLWNLFGNGSFNRIADQFKSIEQVTDALRKSGLESCNLIFGIDYTMSNMSQGASTFGGRSLHALLPDALNPYQQVISLMTKTLSSFDEDNIIPAFGFGDLNTKDHSVFPLTPEGYCIGIDGVLKAYGNVTQYVKMSGPTSFAPLIYRAVEIVKETKSYHILIIIADGQVTNDKPNIDAIVHASNYPLSIIMVGVGDGPWGTMRAFDDKLPERKFDNFQFVEFHKLISNQSTYKNPEAAFALHALMEIPDQFKILKSRGLIGL